MVDIEPCPWCGRDAKLQKYLNSSWVDCSDKVHCHSSGPGRKTSEDAIAAWNRVAGQRWRPIETAPEDRRGLMIHVKPGVGATHWRPALEPPEPPPIETSGYYEVTGKEPIP